MSTVSRLTALSAVFAPVGVLLVPARSSTVPSGDAFSSFGILGGPAVTCTRSTTAGDVGVASATAFTSTGGTISGTIHASDAAAGVGERGRGHGVPRRPLDGNARGPD